LRLQTLDKIYKRIAPSVLWTSPPKGGDNKIVPFVEGGEN